MAQGWSQTRMALEANSGGIKCRYKDVLLCFLHNRTSLEYLLLSPISLSSAQCRRLWTALPGLTHPQQTQTQETKLGIPLTSYLSQCWIQFPVYLNLSVSAITTDSCQCCFTVTKVFHPFLPSKTRSSWQEKCFQEKMHTYIYVSTSLFVFHQTIGCHIWHGAHFTTCNINRNKTSRV